MHWQTHQLVINLFLTTWYIPTVVYNAPAFLQYRGSVQKSTRKGSKWPQTELSHYRPLTDRAFRLNKVKQVRKIWSSHPHTNHQLRSTCQRRSSGWTWHSRRLSEICIWVHSLHAKPNFIFSHELALSANISKVRTHRTLKTALAKTMISESKP